ncbi:P-loop containing nucleoside triphosphate hydrolase [Holotrichia oblita]|uniref:P-loop containing nucleoside triphosphate hydrolase n=1 Tax=Holotrichia oblita TaxID=644536 RepID=A0ACB9SZR4_HOLOL|nr:P-loop containing nucleoside triphosphate hydrolase [Holotrichia oblita]
MGSDFQSYKVLVLGDSGVGKTSIVETFCGNKYKTFDSTINSDLKCKIINLNGASIKLEIWDTAGQERYKSLTPSFYRDAMGVLLIYDVTRIKTFEHIKGWLQDIKEYTSPHVSIVLVGNKCESSDRQVSLDTGNKLADMIRLPLLEVSSKNNINVETAFMTLARGIEEVIKENVGFKLYKTLTYKCKPSSLGFRIILSEKYRKMLLQSMKYLVIPLHM